MDKQRWKPLVGTPSKPPVPPNILVPDPSPARSAISDADSVTILPPSPQGSFIHRRRQGLYVPRPPVRELFGPAQEIKDYDFGYSEVDPIRDQARVSARWSGFQLPWISVDDQVRKMADVFYDQPLVVNMMTGQQTHHDGSEGPAGHREQESKGLLSQLEKLRSDPSPEIPGSQAINSGDPSTRTTAVGSNRSTKLLEGSNVAELPGSVDTTMNAGGVVQPGLDPLLSDTPSADIIMRQSLSVNAGHHNHQPTSDPGQFRSEQSAMGPARRAGPGFESSPQHDESNGDYVELQSHDSTPSITGQMTSTQGSSGSTDDASLPAPSDGTRQEPTFLQRAAYAAAHLGAAQRLPRSLRNTDEADVAGLINIPHAPTEPVGANESQQDSQASKKSKRKTILGFFHRSTEQTAGSSASAKLAGRQRGRSEEEHAHDDGHEEGATESQTPTEPRPIVVQEGKKRTMGARIKNWAVRTIGKSSRGPKSNIANLSAANTLSAQSKSLLNNRSTDETDTGAHDDRNEKEDHNLEGKTTSANPARLSDAQRPLLGSTRQSEVEDGTPRPSDESSSVSQGVQTHQPSTWGPIISHDTHRPQGAAVSSVSPTEDHPSDTTDFNPNIDARIHREIATGPIPRYINPFTKPPRQIPANTSPSNLLEERGCQIQQDTIADSARPAFATEESPFSDEINPRRSYVSDATLNFVYKPKESDTDSLSQSTASKDISPKTTPAMASRPPAAISSDAVNADDVATPSQTPLADITNRNPSPERSVAGLQSLQFPLATAQPTIVTDTPRQRPVDDVPLEEELILPPAQPGSSFGPRPNELREEIRTWKEVTKKLESR